MHEYNFVVMNLAVRAKPAGLSFVIVNLGVPWTLPINQCSRGNVLNVCFSSSFRRELPQNQCQTIQLCSEILPQCNVRQTRLQVLCMSTQSRNSSRMLEIPINKTFSHPLPVPDLTFRGAVGKERYSKEGYTFCCAFPVCEFSINLKFSLCKVNREKLPFAWLELLVVITRLFMYYE